MAYQSQGKSNNSPSSVVILAGGRGTRLKDVARGVPKILAPIHGMPFLHWKLKSLQSQGVTKVLLLLGYGAEDVIDYLKFGMKSVQNKIKIDYKIDQHPNLGTGKALLDAMELLPPKFTLTYGDNLLNHNVSSLWKLKRTTMLVTSNVNSENALNVWIGEKKRIIKYSKSQTGPFGQVMDYGYIEIIKSDLHELFKNTEVVDLGEIFQRLISKEKLFYLKTSKPWFEIGTPNSLKATENSLIQGDVLGVKV